MNIYALAGHKVMVTEGTKNSGYNPDKEKVAEHLQLDVPYTVRHTEVDRCSTRIYLKEFPDMNFNSVSFEDVEEQSPEDDKRHADWSKYN